MKRDGMGMSRIVLVAPRIPYGGAERQMVEFKDQFPAEVTLVDLSKNVSIDEHGSQQAFNIIGPGLKNKLHRAYCMYKLYREYSTTTDTVFVFYNSVFLWLAYFLSRKGHKVFFSLREYNRDFFKFKYLHVFRQLEGVFTNTPRLMNDLMERGIAIRLTLNTINFASNETDNNKPARDKNKLLIVSNVEPHKQIFEVLDALKGCNYEIFIAGALSNNLYAEKCKQSAEAGSCNVHFLGSIPRADLVGHYQTCGCFIHASLVEGTSNAIIDAIVHQAPLIVGNTPENRYLVDDLPEFLWENDSLPARLNEIMQTSDTESYRHFLNFLRSRIQIKFGQANLLWLRDHIRL